MSQNKAKNKNSIVVNKGMILSNSHYCTFTCRV